MNRIGGGSEKPVKPNQVMGRLHLRPSPSSLVLELTYRADARSFHLIFITNGDAVGEAHVYDVVAHRNCPVALDHGELIAIDNFIWDTLHPYGYFPDPHGRPLRGHTPAEIDEIAETIKANSAWWRIFRTHPNAAATES